MATVGLIGLGNMGAPMAANLVKAGHRVKGFDVVAKALKGASATGVIAMASAAEAASEADVVITMLPAGEHLLSLYDGAESITRAAAPGTLFIDCSTVDIASALRAHAIAEARGLPSLDAPVSGGVAGARAATLTFMVGGKAEAFERARPILEAMGRRVVHCGQAGTGQAAKICNNLILGVSMIAVCEAFLLAETLGLSHQALFDVASNSSGQCWSLTSYCPVPGPVPASPANNEYRPGFTAALMLKDLDLAQDAARRGGAVTPLGAEAAQLYRLYAAHGGGPEDFSGIIRFLRARGTASS